MIAKLGFMHDLIQSGKRRDAGDESRGRVGQNLIVRSPEGTIAALARIIEWIARAVVMSLADSTALAGIREA